MNSKCPACHKDMTLNLMQIMDEDIITCPNCANQFQVQLSPETKAVLEATNEEIFSYMNKYPHKEPAFNRLPSGMMDTIE